MTAGQEMRFTTERESHHPRKPWTSMETAAMATSTPPLRAELHKSRRALRFQQLVCYWTKWCLACRRRPSYTAWRRCTRPAVFRQPLMQVGPYFRHPQGCEHLPKLRRREALALSRLRAHRSKLAAAITNDLDNWAAQIAVEAETAATEP